MKIQPVKIQYTEEVLPDTAITYEVIDVEKAIKDLTKAVNDLILEREKDEEK